MNEPRADFFARLRSLTTARVGLGRSGSGMPTAPLLEFQVAHARARNAVYDTVNEDELARQMPDIAPIVVESRARDRREFLQRPDLGRRLRDADAKRLPRGEFDIVFVLADGLSATALHAHSVPVLTVALAALEGWRIAPIVIAKQARVALGDEVALALNAAAVAVLIGERPGLAVADSLGVYVTWHPHVSTADSERNCISNIHAGGLTHTEAAGRLVWLLTNAKARGMSGVALKDEYRGPDQLAGATSAPPALPDR